MTRRYFIINGKEHAVDELEGPLCEVDKDRSDSAEAAELPLPSEYVVQMRWQGWAPARAETSERGSLTGKLVAWNGGRLSFLTNQFTLCLAPDVDVEHFRHEYPDIQLRRLPFIDPIYQSRFSSSWSDDDHPESLLARIRERGLVAFAEPEFVDFVAPGLFGAKNFGVAPTDFSHMQDWQWDEQGLNVRDVWVDHMGEGQRIGIIDLAFQKDHHDLVVPTAYRITDDGPIPSDGWGPGDPREHGTFCAGLAAARANAFGVSGAAPMAQLVLVGLDKLSQPRLASAISLCWQAGARVVSCSLGPCTSYGHSPGNCYDWETIDSGLETAFREAAQAFDGMGTCLFWTTRNSSGSVLSDPVCNRDEIFAIGCMGPLQERGPGAQGTKVYLAPGRRLGSTWPRDGGGTYRTHPSWANSYATPCAAGVAALLIEQDPALTVRRIHDLLRPNCRPVSGALGFGAVDAGRTL